MQQVQRQQLQQKFSPQQIQLMKLLQLPVTDLEQAIKEEVEKNPLLDAEPPDEEPLPSVDNNTSDWDPDDDDGDDFDYDYREHLPSDPNASRREFTVSDNASFTDRLLLQLSMLPIDDRQRTIAAEIVGTLDDAGYLSRDLALVANDMAFRRGLDIDLHEAEEALRIVQSLDPPGIGARSLQECLALQLQRTAAQPTALAIVQHHFDDFANHRYERICADMGISQQELDNAADVIRRLNPKPAGSAGEDTDTSAFVTPDIILTQHDGQLQFYINDTGLPRLSLNSYYTDMLHSLEQQHGDKATIQFLRSKQADAQGFIDLLSQRHDTIVRVMRYIVRHQGRYLLSGNPDLLVPMRQREVAEATGLDISTVSRMANSKYLQTDFGTIPLKNCFSKGLQTESGEEVAVETIKQRLAEAIAAEDKSAPLSDDALAQALKEQGMPLARRTVAKYREQLGIPVARLRRLVVLVLMLLGAAGAEAQMSYYDSIMAARIEAGARRQKRIEATAKPVATPKPPKADKPASKAPAPAAEAPAIPSPSASVDPAIVPMWYDAFPQHRVNPLGRTRVDQMPDEINLRLAKDSSDFCFPVRNSKTSPYGWRWRRGHHGVDIRLNTGDPVRAAFAGTVRVASRMGGYGNCVVVRHPNGLETLYGHLSKIHVKFGQHVEAGEIVGLGGSTGNSTGPHLHFECRFMYQTFDPEWILDFENYSLRTRRLHLDKSYFGIHQPQKGKTLEYKADDSSIAEPKKKRKTQPREYTTKDF